MPELNIPADLMESNKVEFLLIGHKLMLETVKELKAAGVGEVAIAGVAQGLGAAVAGAFNAYGMADAASMTSGKQDRRSERMKARMARLKK